jgi:membrane protease YdiL (CAAX protease family)
MADRLNTRIAALIEILLVPAITVGHHVFHIVPLDETYPIFVLGWISLRLRKVGWKAVGFSAPGNWMRVLGLGIGAGILLQLLSSFVTEPMIAWFTHQIPDVAEFRPLVGNLKLVLLYFVLVWTVAAFGEELTYRGYILNRAADLGGRTILAWAVALAFGSSLFAFGHSYQGIAGMIDTGIHGLILGVVYFLTGRNLWACIITHGVSDTIAIALVFAGHL